MNPSDLSSLSDEQLQAEAKKTKPSPLLDAFFIGFLVGIIIYSVVANTWGLLTLIPLFLVYMLMKKPKKYEAVKRELQNRRSNWLRNKLPLPFKIILQTKKVLLQRYRHWFSHHEFQESWFEGIKWDHFRANMKRTALVGWPPTDLGKQYFGDWLCWIISNCND